MKRLFSLFLIASAWLFGQGPGLGAWWDSPVARDINLSEPQRKQIQATVRGYRDQLIQQRADVQKAEGALGDLMNEDQVNEAKVNEAIDRVVAARGAMMKTVSVMSLKLRVVLTPEQWRQVRERRPRNAMGPGQGPMRPERRMERRLGRPGRPEPPNPPGPPPAGPRGLSPEM